MKRTTKEWRARYGPASSREHHLVPQAMLNNKKFTERLQKLGINDAKTYIDKKIAIIANGAHIDIHNKKWNDKWKKWLSKNPNFTTKDIEKQIKEMMKEYNIPKSSRMSKLYGRN